MSKKSRRGKARAEPPQKRSAAWLCAPETFDSLACSGYVSLASNPEIAAGVDTIARLVGAMTIHLMRNGQDGDVRVRNGLSRKLDIEPNRYMTRGQFIHWIVRTMYLEGHGNAVAWPVTRDGLLEDLTPVPPSLVSFVPDGWGYRVTIAGQEHGPDEVLHFALGHRVPGLARGRRPEPQADGRDAARVPVLEVEAVADRQGRRPGR